MPVHGQDFQIICSSCPTLDHAGAISKRIVLITSPDTTAGTSLGLSFGSTSQPPVKRHHRPFGTERWIMAGPPVRERYNAKARGSVAGGGSHKKRKRLGAAKAAGSEDESGAPAPVQPAPGQGMSAKKRKRMESYIVSHP